MLEQKKKKHLQGGRRGRTSCKSYLSILCNAIYPEIIWFWVFFLVWFFVREFPFEFFSVDSGASRKYIFGPSCVKSTQAQFLSGTVCRQRKTFAETQLFSPLRSCCQEPFQFCSYFAVKRSFFPVYRAVNTTNSDRGNCCGCNCGSVAVVLSADLHVTSD